jgi:hypothetical protein
MRTFFYFFFRFCFPAAAVLAREKALQELVRIKVDYRSHPNRFFFQIVLSLPWNRVIEFVCLVFTFLMGLSRTNLILVFENTPLTHITINRMTLRRRLWCRSLSRPSKF